MTIRLFMIFKVVVEQGSMSKAAKQLYMSQPAITHAIQELEQSLDILLFDRIGRVIHVNEAGKIFYEKVCDLLIRYDDLHHFKAEMDSGLPIRIGSSITIANFQLPNVIQQYHNHYSNPITVTIENARDIIKKVKANELDFAFIEGNMDDEGLCTVLLSSYTLSVFCATNSPLASKKEHTMTQLSKEAFLLREEGSAIRDTFDMHMRLQQISITPQWTSVNSQALIQAVLARQGIGVLPTMLVADNEHLHMLKIKDLHMDCPMYIIYQKGKVMSERIDEMIEEAKQMFIS